MLTGFLHLIVAYHEKSVVPSGYDELSVNRMRDDVVRAVGVDSHLFEVLSGSPVPGPNDVVRAGSDHNVVLQRPAQHHQAVGVVPGLCCDCVASLRLSVPASVTLDTESEGIAREKVNVTYPVDGNRSSTRFQEPWASRIQTLATPSLLPLANRIAPRAHAKLSMIS